MTADVSRLPVAQADTMPRGLQIQSWDDMLARAEYLAKSQLIPQALRGKPADVAIILQIGLEVGLNPMQALNSIDVIQGKPAIKPEAQLALIYQKVPGALISIDVDPVGRKVTVAMARAEGKAQFRTVWDMKRAGEMGLANKENYQKQPLVMLKWRAVGEAARTVFPDIIRGMFNTFEAEDFDDNSGSAGGSNSDDIKSRFEQKSEPKDVACEVGPVAKPIEPVIKAPTKPESETFGDEPSGPSMFDLVAQAQRKAQAAADAIDQNEDNAYRITFGQYAGKTLDEVGPNLAGLLKFVEDAIEKSGKAPSKEATDFMVRARGWIGMKRIDDSETKGLFDE